MTTVVVTGPITFRKNTAANLASRVLADAEPAWATDAKVFKIGDGVQAFSALPGFTPNAPVDLTPYATITSLTAGLAGKEGIIVSGTPAQYWRGDKSWQALDKAAVGLGGVDNTADAVKVVLSASKLTTARTINGVSFDGTGNITVTASSSPYSIVTKTAGYTETATSGEVIIKADLAAGFTILLPTAIGNTATISVVKMQVAGLITVDGAGSETIDGGLTAVLNNQYESITLKSDGSGWVIV